MASQPGGNPVELTAQASGGCGQVGTDEAGKKRVCKSVVLLEGN